MSNHKPDPGTWKNFNRKRHGIDHITNCSSGYRKSGKNQVHHIVCVSAVADSNLPKGKKLFIRSCMKVTDWDINNGGNNIGLPLKIAYFQYEKAKNKTTADTSWDGFPCHMVDHPDYTKDVIKYLKKNIWDKLKAAKKKNDCDKVEGKSIASQLDKASTHFRSFLTKRGSGKTPATGKGALACWKERDTNPKWYIPFSMAQKATQRQAPPSNLPKNQKEALDSLFRTI